MANEPTIRAYGGQAVIGGVMMRGATTWAVAVRRPSGEIVIDSHPVPTWSAPWLRVPVVRGLATLVESFTLGMKALDWAGRQAEPDDEPAGEAGFLERAVTAAALVVGLALFIVLPAVVARSLPGVNSGLRLSVVEGVLRIGLLMGYMSAIGRVPEIRRVYEYHGAEHKAVTALESGAELTPESVQRFTTRHPRCGTTFLLVVMVVAIVVHAFIGRPALPMLIASRVLLVPLVAGLSYELIRAATRHLDQGWVMAAMAPGLALQRLTTREPTTEQLEVSLAALHTVLAADGRGMLAA
jgi:uncharacterized protein YqhQ